LLRQVIAEEGAAGLFVGLQPRLAIIAPACAIMISSYEFAKVYFARSASVGIGPEPMQI
jgi:solute carrier family 25 protein 39/40